MTLSACRICGGAQTELHSTFRRLPLYIWPLPEGQTHELEDAELYLCVHCGHLQLQDFPREFFPWLYSHEAFNVEDTAENLRRRLRVEAALGEGCFRGQRILDIGGGVNSFAATLDGAETWVCDFMVSPEEERAVAKVIEGDILDMALPEGVFDFVILSHCLEHLNTPAPVAEKVRGLLKPGGAAIVEVPNAPEVISRMPYYAVFHQHVGLFSLEALDRLLAGAGLQRRSLLREDGVLLAVYALGEGTQTPPSGGRRHADLLRLRLLEWEKTLRSVDLDPDSRRVGLYGAGGSASLFLAHFPWFADRIGRCFDIDPRKQGRFLPGGQLRIQSPAEIESSGVRQLLFLSSALHGAVAGGRSVQTVDLESLSRKVPT